MTDRMTKRTPRKGGPWPKLGVWLMVRDRDSEPWRKRMSAGGGYYFHDEYGTDVWELKLWEEVHD